VDWTLTPGLGWVKRRFLGLHLTLDRRSPRRAAAGHQGIPGQISSFAMPQRRGGATAVKMACSVTARMIFCKHIVHVDLVLL
jgi:hypothetical protein